MTKAKKDAQTSEPSLESLEKVRELLFGSQLGEVESKISSAEKQLGMELKSLNAQTQASIDTLERFTREELDNLAQLIAEERTRREDQGDDHTAEHERDVTSLEKKIGSLEEKLSDTAKTLRQQSKESIQELRDQTQTQLDGLQEFVTATDERLSSERVHRDVLAGLFREVASQLDSESIGDVDSVLKAVADSKTE